MTKPEIGCISPNFIVNDAAATLAFYRDQLGFEVTFQAPAENPFFGIVQRGGAMLMFKTVGIEPLPNHKKHKDARWDAYLYVPDPDALADEYISRGVVFSQPLRDTHDGLLGFEIEDSDGYTLFFGRPQATGAEQ